jgi:hypothetical protein
MADISITSSDVLASSQASYFDGIAAAAITAGQVVYKTAANTYNLSNATGSSPVNSTAGIAANNAAAGQPIRIVASDPAFVFGGAATAGEVLYMSPNNAGGITGTYGDLSSGNTVIVLGLCVTGGAAGTAAIALAPSLPATHG